MTGITISKARSITGYYKLDFDEYDKCKCDYCESACSRHNAGNEKKTSYEYEEYNFACNKCVKSMAEAVLGGASVVVGIF